MENFLAKLLFPDGVTPRGFERKRYMNTKGVLIGAVAVCICVLGASGFFVLKADRKAAEEVSMRTALWNEERGHLEAELSRARAGISHVAGPEREITSGLDPIVLVQRLRSLGDDNRKRVRQALFCFQGLVEAGVESIEPIKSYFLSGDNVQLSGMGRGSGGPFGEQTGMQGFANGMPMPGGMGERMGMMGGMGRGGGVVPSSTRQGLMEVLGDIGGDEAIGLLGQLVPTAADASELVYLSRVLQGIDASAFRNVTITTARNLLADSQINNFDKRQLFELLSQLGDTEYAAALQDSLLVDGRVDGTTLDFLIRSLGEGAMPAIYSSFMDPNIGQPDQARLMASAMNFVGSNAQANEMFSTALDAIADNPGMQGMMLMGLSGVGPGSEGLSPDVAQNRLNYLATLESQYANNQNMQNLLNGVREQLEYSANPGAYAEPPQMDFRRMLGGGPGGRMQGMGGRGQRGGGGGPGR